MQFVYTVCALIALIHPTFSIDIAPLVGTWSGLRIANAGISSNVEDQCFQSRGYAASTATAVLEYNSSVADFVMQVDAAGTFLTPTIAGTTYYSTVSALSSQGSIINTTNHLSIYDTAKDTTYCSYTTTYTFTPSSTTPVVAERSFLWLNPTILSLSMTTNDCPTSSVAPYCTGPPVSTTSPFSQVMGFTLSKPQTLTGSLIYMAKLTNVPGVTRIVLTSQSGPVDVILIDEFNFSKFAAGLNFRYYTWFSYLSVENLDETVTLSGDMTGDFYYLITYARGGTYETIKPASVDQSKTSTFADTLASETTHPRIHSKLYNLSSIAVTATETPPPLLSISLMMATAGVESLLVPVIAQAWSQELYVQGPSGALPSWLLGVIIAGGVVVLTIIMAIVIYCTRKKDQGSRICCRCCYSSEMAVQPMSRDHSQRHGGDNASMGLAAAQAQRSDFAVQMGAVSPAQKGLYGAYANTSSVPGNGKNGKGYAEMGGDTPTPLGLHSVKGSQGLNPVKGQGLISVKKNRQGKGSSHKDDISPTKKHAKSGEEMYIGSSITPTIVTEDMAKAKPAGKKTKKAAPSSSFDGGDVYPGDDDDNDSSMSLASYLGASEATVSFSAKHIPKTSMAATVSDAAIATGQYDSPRTHPGLGSTGLSELLHTMSPNDATVSRKVSKKVSGASAQPSPVSEHAPMWGTASVRKGGLAHSHSNSHLMATAAKGSLVALRHDLDLERQNSVRNDNNHSAVNVIGVDNELDMLRSSYHTPRNSVTARQAELFKPRSSNVNDKAFFSYDATKEDVALGNVAILTSLARNVTATATQSSGSAEYSESPPEKPSRLLARSSSTSALKPAEHGSLQRPDHLTPARTSFNGTVNLRDSGQSSGSQGFHNGLLHDPVSAPKYLTPRALPSSYTHLSTLTEVPVLPREPLPTHLSNPGLSNNQTAVSPAAAGNSPVSPSIRNTKTSSSGSSDASGTNSPNPLVRVGKLRLKPQV